MALDTPTFVSPVPGQSTIESFNYVVSTQGLDTRPLTPGTMLGLDLLEYPRFKDPRVTEPAVIGTILYSEIIVVTKKFEIPNQAPWYYGTGTDGDGHSHSGWFQKE